MSREAQYSAKVARRERVNQAVTRSDEIRARDFIIDDLLAADYAGTALGTFRNVERIHLRWDRPDWFEYPRPGGAVQLHPGLGRGDRARPNAHRRRHHPALVLAEAGPLAVGPSARVPRSRLGI